eukprot:GHVN01017698.1.p1 GENE.GHVN01017698.1~~GHVN01017698.1.p1  ORF type:complete len:244 (-),score=32.34 GHVN01017698.1:284-1015(-)
MQPYAAQQGVDPVTKRPVTYYIYPPQPVPTASPPAVTQYSPGPASATPVYTVHSSSPPVPISTMAPTVKKTRVIREETTDCGMCSPEPTGFTCGDDCANMECGPSRIWCNLLNPLAMCATLCPRPRTRDGKNPMDVECTFRDGCPCFADVFDWLCCYNCEPRPVRRVRVAEQVPVMVEPPQIHTVCVECGEVLDVHTAGTCSHPSHQVGGYQEGIPVRRRRGGYREVPPFPNGERSRYHYEAY